MSLLEDLSNPSMFTKGELTVVEYIKENSNKIVNMSINELARETYSSNSTIIRICQKLGFKGYKDFKIDYAKNIESLKYVNNDINFSLPFENSDSTNEIINKMANLYKDGIDLINSELNIDNLEKIIELLNNSQRVFVYAHGDSKITASLFLNKLIKIGKFFYLATENGEELSFSQSVTLSDCCLFITYDKNESFYECMRNILKRRCPIILISARKDSLLMKYSNYQIIIPHKENEKIATFYSQLAFHYLLNVIYALLYQRNVTSNKK